MQEEEIELTAGSAMACSLTAADLRNRQKAWRKLGAHITAFEDAPGGLDLSFAPVGGLLPALRRLVALEAECCAWMQFEITDTRGEVRLSIRAKGEDGERGVRESFAELTRG